MSELTKREHVYQVFEEISHTYDSANRRISLGLQAVWKRSLVRQVLRHTEKGDRVLDVCCGTGDIALALARNGRTAVGVDFSPSMLEVARRRGRDQPGLAWERGDAMSLPFADGSFSAACISFGLRNTEDYGKVLQEMRRVVRPGGCVCCLDSFVPEPPIIRPFYQWYFHRIMPWLGGGHRHREEYLWLWQSTQHFLTKEQLRALFDAVGLGPSTYKSHLFGACVLHMGCRPAESVIPTTDQGGYEHERGKT